MAKLKATPDWLRANTAEKPMGVDRQREVINGFIVAEEGPFRSEGRGEFDGKSLKSILQLMRSKPNGLKSRFTHPSLSSDGLGTLLGRAKNPRLEKVLRLDAEGKEVERQAIRADLHLSPTSHNTPNGDLGTYVMDLADEALHDADAMGASLVLQANEEMRLEKDGSPKRDANGDPLPPLWRPTMLHAIDVVDTGDATRAFLSGDLDSMPDGVVRKAAALIEAQFKNEDRPTVEARCSAWLKRAMDLKFGNQPEEKPAMTREQIKARQDELLAKPMLTWAETRELFSLCEPETEFDRIFTQAVLAGADETETLRLRKGA